MAIALLVAPSFDRFPSRLRNSTTVRSLRYLYPVFLLGPFYRWTYHISGLYFSAPFDGYLLAVDRYLFGFDISRDLVHILGDRWWLTEWMNFSYLSYYCVTLYLPIYLYATGRMNVFFETSFIAGIVIFACFAIQSVLPAQGPIHYDPTIGGYLKAGPISAIAACFLSRADIPGGAMPSGHIAGTVAVLLLARRYARKAFWLTLPIALSLCVSTVYCRYHYAVDGIAGIAIAVVGVYWIGPRLYALLCPFLSPSQVAYRDIEEAT